MSKIANTANLHKELTVGFSTEIDAIPEELVFARFKVKNLKDTIKFTINWSPRVSKDVRDDLRIYLSCKYREPSDHKCTIIIQNVSYFY